MGEQRDVANIRQFRREARGLERLGPQADGDAGARADLQDAADGVVVAAHRQRDDDFVEHARSDDPVNLFHVVDDAQLDAGGRGAERRVLLAAGFRRMQDIHDLHDADAVLGVVKDFVGDVRGPLIVSDDQPAALIATMPAKAPDHQTHDESHAQQRAHARGYHRAVGRARESRREHLRHQARQCRSKKCRLEQQQEFGRHLLRPPRLVDVQPQTQRKEGNCGDGRVDGDDLGGGDRPQV